MMNSSKYRPVTASDMSTLLVKPTKMVRSAPVTTGQFNGFTCRLDVGNIDVLALVDHRRPAFGLCPIERGYHALVVRDVFGRGLVCLVDNRDVRRVQH